MITTNSYNIYNNSICNYKWAIMSASSRKKWCDKNLDMLTFLIIQISNNFIYYLYTKI